MPRVVAVTATMLIIAMMLARPGSAKQAALTPEAAGGEGAAQALVSGPHRAKHHGAFAAKRPHLNFAGPAAEDPQAREASAKDLEPSGAALRFREFVNPRSIAVSRAQELRHPQPQAAQFALEPVYALAVSWLEPEGEPQEPASGSLRTPGATDAADVIATSSAPDQQQVENEAAQNAQRTTAIEQMLSSRRPLPNKDTPSSSWIELAFLAWGGLLTIGSAMRMLIG
jgi:hypothetical protein